MRFINPSKFELCEMDIRIRRIYLAISKDNWVIRKHKKVEFNKEKTCGSKETTPKKTPRTISEPLAVDWKGGGIISLCSKTCYCFGDQNKMTCEDLNKITYTYNITKNKYMNVLPSQMSSSGVNRGFRMKSGEMYIYQQYRNRLFIPLL